MVCSIKHQCFRHCRSAVPGSAGNGVFQNQWAVFLISLLLIAVCYAVIEQNARYIRFTLNGLEGTRKIVVYTVIWVVSLAVIIYGLSFVEDPSKISSFYAG